MSLGYVVSSQELNIPRRNYVIRSGIVGILFRQIASVISTSLVFLLTDFCKPLIRFAKRWFGQDCQAFPIVNCVSVSNISIHLHNISVKCCVCLNYLYISFCQLSHPLPSCHQNVFRTHKVPFCKMF